MAYNAIEKQRLEEYKRNLSLVGTNQSSINMPTPTNIPGATNYLPTRSGQQAMAIKKAQNEVNNNTWFKKSQAMDDENKARGLALTAASTGYDITGNLLRGVGSIIEGASDTVKYGYAGVQSLLGNKEKAKKIRDEAAQVNNFEGFLGFDDNITKDSVLGKKSEGVAQGIGYYGGMVALQSVGVPWQLTAGVTSAGSSLGEAFNDGASTSDAIKYALVSTAAEIGSEYMFSGLGKLAGTGALDDVVIGNITKQFKNQYIKTLAEFGLKSAGEGVEEIASGWISEVAKRLTYMSDKDKTKLQNAWAGTKDYYTKQAADDFWSGTIVSAISGVAMPGEGNLVNNLRNAGNTNMNLETQQQEENTKGITNVEDLVINEQKDSNNVNINTNVDAINTRISEITEQISEYRQLQQENRITQQQLQQMTELQTELNNLQKQLNTITDTNNQNKSVVPTVNQIVSKESSTNTNSSRQILPTANDLTKNSINIQETNKTMPTRELNLVESAKANNINPTSEPIVSINQMLSSRGIKSRFDANLFSDSNANAIWRTTVNENGETVREVIFNPNADTKQLIQDVAIHELYHDMVAGGNVDLLTEMIKSFNMQFPDFQKARQELARTYSKAYQNSNNFEQAINEEVVANILAQKLGSQEYINRLVHERPSLAKQIYDFVIDKLNQLNRLVGYKSEKIFWEDVKNKFEKAYREEYKNTKNESESRYSIIGINGVKNLTESPTKKLLIDSYNYAVELSNKNVSNEEIYKQTYWYQDDKGNWKIEIPDNKMAVKYNQKIKPGVEYKLGDIISHDLLFSLYPELKDYSITFKNYDSKSIIMKMLGKSKNMKKGGNFNSVTKAISVNKNWLSKKNYDSAIRKTLIHEIQHAIQNIEGFETGASSRISMQHYLSSKGEAEARTTSERLDYSDQTRKRTLEPFFKAQQNNLDKRYNDYMNNRGVIDKIKDNLYNYLEKVLSNENSKEMDIQFEDENIGLANDRGLQGYVDEKNVQKNKGFSEKNVRSDILHRMNEELDNSSFSYKQKQLDIIKNNNPVNDDYHTWIRTIDDIKTLQETIEDSDWAEYDEYNPDLTKQDIENAIESGKITVYSSYPIEQGTFVTPSKMEAQSYSADGKVYSKEINIEDAAWIDPTQAQYAKVGDEKYSQSNSKWQEYLDRHYQKEGTGQTLNELRLLEEKTEQVKAQNNNLTDEEAKELYVLENLPFDLDQQETQRLEYLKNKEKGYSVKFPELKKNITYKDIKTEYAKYRDLTNFDSKALNTAKQYVPGYRNTDKRTKQQWLNVANFIGSNIKTDSSKELTKYAIQSWFSAKPNTKDTLNRQGQKYVKFSIEDWVNEVYKGAGVGDLVKTNNPLPVKASISASNQVDTSDNQIIPIDANKLKKTMNPNEISQLTKQDANTTPILPTRKVETGKGESSFARNISEKTNMLTEESKKSILAADEVNYYKQVTNEESLNKAFDRINNGGQSEVYNWMTKSSENATSIDVAEGWILLKQYQDQIQNETDISKKDDLNRSMVEVAKKMRDMGTKAGQTVQAFNIMNRLTPEGMVYYAQSELQEAYEKMSKNKTKEWIDANRENFNLTPEETQFIMDNMEQVRNMEDGYDKRVKLAEIQKLMTDKLPAEKGAAIKSWMRISMLFNPKTQVRNVAGNALIAPVNYFGDIFASYADKIIAKKTGVRTTGNMNVNAILKGMKEGAYQSTNDYKKGINTKDMEGNRFELTEGKSFNDKTAIGKSLNRVEALLNYVMDAGDRVFSQASFENSIQNQMILNNTTEITQDMIDIARAESLQRTWNDNNNYTRFVLNVRKGLNNVANIGGYGLGDILIPFAKTPANLTKAIIDYSPAGLIKTLTEGKNLKNSLKNGQYNAKMQHEFVQDLGKATAGTMLYILGYALASAGITSGESDDDKDTANFMKNTLGVNSYSIKIGGKTFTYDWAQPLAAPLSITANIVNKNKEGASLKDNILSSLDTAGNILLEQSFLESLNTVFNNSDGIATGIEEAIFELPSRAVPTLMKQVADLVDGTQRTTFEYDKPLETAINKVKAKIPFMSKTLTPSVDTMGREIQKYGGKNNIFNVFLNPANVNTENISTSAAEIYRLYKATGDTTIMPRVAPYYINKDGEKTIMTSQQRAEYQKISGNTIEQNINNMLNDSRYNSLSDTEKAEMVNEVVNYSYNKARQEVLGMEMSNKYNKINLYTNDGGTVSDYYLNKEEIDYSYNYPEKYKTITQITTYDKYLTYQDKIDTLKKEYTNTNQRKNAVVEYVNSLDLSIVQKAMLIRMNYSSFNGYDNQIIEYINNQDLTIQEKSDILTKLGFKVKDGRVYQ